MSLAPCFSGLPGETSHHSSSSPSARSAARLICRCPRWAGLNEPPRRPMRAIARALACGRQRRIMIVRGGNRMGESRGDRRRSDRRGRRPRGRAQAPAKRPTATRTRRQCLNCGTRAVRPLLPRVRPARACPPHARRVLPRFRSTACCTSKARSSAPCRCWRGAGELTRRYIDGQRARFVSPIALFLFCVFLTFAVMGLTGHVLGEVPGAVKQDIAKISPTISRRSRSWRRSAKSS